MRYNIVYLLLGIIFGYVVMMLTSNIFIYHGGNSNYIKQQWFNHNGINYRFVPRVLCDKK